MWLFFFLYFLKRNCPWTRIPVSGIDHPGLPERMPSFVPIRYFQKGTILIINEVNKARHSNLWDTNFLARGFSNLLPHPGRPGRCSYSSERQIGHEKI
jgi:hypothetical protein